MDLLAAYFFSITIMEYLYRVSSTKEEAVKISLYASAISALLIASVYIGFVALGAIVYYLINHKKTAIKIGSIMLIMCGLYSCNNVEKKDEEKETINTKKDSVVSIPDFKYDTLLNCTCWRIPYWRGYGRKKSIR
jgi:F0F1-type ATP synthase assembly protein I